MKVEDNVSSITYEYPAFCVDAMVLNRLQLFKKRWHVNHATTAHQVGTRRVYNAGWKYVHVISDSVHLDLETQLLA